ncbi:MAG: AAA-like domain-containing protein [Bacteroidota bacterium]
MPKFFNVAGPCFHKLHYILPTIERNPAVFPLIEEGHYFVIHAARQSGKTTLLQELVRVIEAKGDFHALYCSLEEAQGFNDPNTSIPQILHIMRSAIRFSSLPNRADFAKNVDTSAITTLIKDAIQDLCAGLDKPLVLLFDEIDTLQNGTLISFLRQLRSGFVSRNMAPFPHSIALVGMRNVRDYKIKIRPERETLGSPSPFNIITDALTITNFSLREVKLLYQQHTDATGQVFGKSVIEKIYEHTSGQPWLINAIAREITVRILQKDYSKKITIPLVEKAIKNILLRRDTHIDSLLERLKEPRVRKVMEPIITGEEYDIRFSDDATQYCLDLGLIKNENGVLKPANKMYAEVIIRTLSGDTQFHLQTAVKKQWVNEDHTLDMNGLMKGFQQFWRENSNIWVEKYEYKEAAPHLILQAFLQRIINSSGDIIREYAANRDRMDLCVRFGQQKYPIEIKIRYHKKSVEKGLEQLANYMDTLGEKTGWLVVFDRRKSITWDKKIYWKTKKVNGKEIHVVGV